VKKIAQKIAMILLLVMLVNVFTGCFSSWNGELLNSGNGFLIFIGAVLLVPCFLLDLITLPIQIWWYTQNRSVYAANMADLLTEAEFAFLTEKTAFMDEEDGAFFMALIASLPEEERASVLEQVNSISEQRLASSIKVMRMLFMLPQEDRVFLTAAVHSMPEKERAFLTDMSNSLSDSEMADLAEEFVSLTAAEMSRSVYIMRETPYSEWGYREYAERWLVK
jgi:hypothetical protein